MRRMKRTLFSSTPTVNRRLLQSNTAEKPSGWFWSRSKVKAMNENVNTDETNPTKPPRQKFGISWFIGYPLMIFGICFTTITTMNYLKEVPREPLLFDLTLRRGSGGFIVYGVAIAILGIVLMLRDVRRRKRVST